jgi:hypothetical protein
MSNFAFLKAEWSEMYDTASNAESSWSGGETEYSAACVGGGAGRAIRLASAPRLSREIMT